MADKLITQDPTNPGIDKLNGPTLVSGKVPLSGLDTSGASSGNVVTLNGGVWVPSAPSGGSTEAIIILQDQKPAGTPGGTFSTGGPGTRDLNTKVADTGNNCTLSGNQFTLLSGTYRIFASAPAHAVDSHQTRLKNITDAVTTVVGCSAYANTNVSESTSIIQGRFTIASTKTFELQHNCSTNKTGDGLGVACNLGEIEVYTTVMLWKE